MTNRTPVDEQREAARAKALEISNLLSGFESWTDIEDRLTDLLLSHAAELATRDAALTAANERAATAERERDENLQCWRLEETECLAANERARVAEERVAWWRDAEARGDIIDRENWGKRHAVSIAAARAEGERAGLRRAAETLTKRADAAEPHAQLANVRAVITGCVNAVGNITAEPPALAAAPIPVPASPPFDVGGTVAFAPTTGPLWTCPCGAGNDPSRTKCRACATVRAIEPPPVLEVARERWDGHRGPPNGPRVAAPDPSGAPPPRVRCEMKSWCLLDDDHVGDCNPVSLTFEAFNKLNVARCEATAGYHTGVAEYGAATWALCLAEEAGEVMGAVLGATGQKKRKAMLTVYDVGKELGDLVAYADLLAHSLGLNLGECVAEKWNKVSERIGYPGRIPDVAKASSGAPPGETGGAVADALCSEHGGRHALGNVRICSVSGCRTETSWVRRTRTGEAAAVPPGTPCGLCGGTGVLARFPYGRCPECAT